MYAWIKESANKFLECIEVPTPIPSEDEVLIKVKTCGICRTDLHVIDNELPEINFPIIPGHQIVGIIVEIGKKVTNLKVGQKVGVAWLASTCGCCNYCNIGQENLCDQASFTGYQKNGGFAEYCVANMYSCFELPSNYSDIELAPLLCAGLIGYRSYKKIPESSSHIGIIGFGSAAHIIIQIANYFNKKIYVFTRDNDIDAQNLAIKLGASWVGGVSKRPNIYLDAIIIYAPVGELVPLSLSLVRKGGIVVCAGIHMSEIPNFSYSLLWGERSLCSVANLTRKDGYEFFQLVEKISVKINANIYSFEETNQAILDLRMGKYSGSYVVKMPD